MYKRLRGRMGGQRVWQPRLELSKARGRGRGSEAQRRAVFSKRKTSTRMIPVRLGAQCKDGMEP